tara:strand:+ start:1955 stop:3163 length:1209 start_codon:yes stop_codon:yes gene_type:complete
MEQTIKTYDIKQNGEVKLMADPNDIKINPFNLKLFANEKAENSKVLELAESFKKRKLQGKIPNKQPVIIWPDGLAEGGNTRTKAAKIANCDVNVVFSDDDYPEDDKPFSHMQTIKESNIHREDTFINKLNDFNLARESYNKEFGFPMDMKTENQYIKDLGTTRETMDKLIEIQNKDSSYLEKVDGEGWNVTKAWNHALGNHLPTVVKSKNPNFDWKPIYTDGLFYGVFHRVESYIQRRATDSVNIDGDDYYPFLDFEPSRQSADISDSIMTITAESLRSKGHEIKHATGHWSDPDIYHITEDDKTEVKVAQYKGAQTQWSGNFGIREGWYILSTYSEDFTRWLHIFTPLTKDDWKLQGNIGTYLPIKNVLENHKNDMRILVGDLFFNKGKVIATLDKLGKQR